jgi:catechol 2,3-dioxygenase-like lactoylglutathione lyase family enzyme
MGEALTKPSVTGLIAMAHVADVQRSVDFYRLLGMEARGSLRNTSGTLQWVHVGREQAELMFTRASEPVIASQQAVLFYLYSPDLNALREYLLQNGVQVSAISYPAYMPKGEIRIEDPDGYVLLIGQAG